MAGKKLESYCEFLPNMIARYVGMKMGKKFLKRGNYGSKNSYSC